MVKYARKVTSSGCLIRSFTVVREDIPKRMPKERLHREPFQARYCGFESRRLRSANGIGKRKNCPSGRKIHQKPTFGNVGDRRATQKPPCLRMDTALSRALPKVRFPHGKGGTQILSHCFCVNDGENSD